MDRTKTKQLNVGGVLLGGGAPVTVQSMCNTDTRDAQASLAQIRRLADAGCEIIRLAVPDEAAADAMTEICRDSPIPVVADIHLDYRLARQTEKTDYVNNKKRPLWHCHSGLFCNGLQL